MEKSNATGKGHGLPCPVCKIDLLMSERQGIEIDYCPECRGVWLDRGELDKIVERSASEAIGGNASNSATDQVTRQTADHGYSSGHGGHGRRRRRRHGSFLERLFD